MKNHRNSTRAFPAIPGLSLILGVVLLTLGLGTRSAEAARLSNSKDAVLVKVVTSERIKLKKGNGYDVTVKAKVLKIKRTGTGLKVGDLITIVYRQDLAREEKDRRLLEKDKKNGEERIGAGAYYRAPATMKVGGRWNLALDQTKEGTYRPDAISMDGMYEEKEKGKYDRWRER